MGEHPPILGKQSDTKPLEAVCSLLPAGILHNRQSADSQARPKLAIREQPIDCIGYFRRAVSVDREAVDAARDRIRGASGEPRDDALHRRQGASGVAVVPSASHGAASAAARTRLASTAMVRSRMRAVMMRLPAFAPA
jgi:hypothetical protein